MTRSQKLENILRNLRDLQVRSQRRDEVLCAEHYIPKGDSILTQLIDLVADLADEIVEMETNPTGIS